MSKISRIDPTRGRDRIGEELPLNLLSPDTVFEKEFDNVWHKRRKPEGEGALMFAVLHGAVADFQKYLFAKDQNGKAFFREAADWILSDDREWPFSFVSLCGVFNINPSYLRKGLKKWKEKQLKTEPKTQLGGNPSNQKKKGRRLA